MTTVTTHLPVDVFPKMADIPSNMRLHAPVHQRHILINGQIREWDGPAHTVYSPIYIKNEQTNDISATVIGSYPLATTQEAAEALQAARQAYDGARGAWPSMTITERIRRLTDFTRLMVDRREEIVKLIVWEIGKSITDAEKEFDRTVDYIHETIAAVKKLHNSGSQFSIQQNFIGQTRKAPLGVVLCMGPFNYPLNETFTTLIPALIMGNTVLFKPPKHGTLLFAPLLAAFAASFPKGVVNTIYGRGKDTVPFLMQSGDIDVLALIGSSKVADSLKKMHPKSNRLKSVLGLDAKNAAIVLADADLELAVKESVTGALSFNGQRCTALKILFVHTAVVKKFNTLLVAAIDKLRVGMPWQRDVSITPLAEPGKPERLKQMIEDALTHGASVINAPSGGGSMFHSLVKPAILYPVNEKMSIYMEEQFGPVIPIVPFDDINTPLEYVIHSPYGQQVSLFGRDSGELSHIIDALSGQVGRININTQCQRGPDSFPFTGRKDSAEGTLSIEDALNAFSTDSVVATRKTSENEQILENILCSGHSRRLNNTVVF